MLAPLSTASVSSAPCLVCQEPAASFAALVCADGHTMCAGCFTGLLASRLGEATSVSPLACTGRSDSRRCAAFPFTTQTAQRALIYGLPAAEADAALARLDLLLKRSTEAETRRAVTRELKRNPPTLESQLIEAASVVLCSACDAPYGAGPDACMHASCPCGHSFCAFCWLPQAQCRTEQCVLNPKPGSIHCTNKEVAFVVVKALAVADLLRGVSAAKRMEALSAPAVREAFAAAGLNRHSPHLVKPTEGYVDALMRSVLERRYGGKDGATPPTTPDLQAIVVGDWITLPDVSLLRLRCQTLPMGNPLGFNREMEALAGKELQVVERIDRRRALKVASLPGSTRQFYIPFDAVVAHRTAAAHAAELQAAAALRKVSGPEAAAGSKRKAEAAAAPLMRKAPRTAAPEAFVMESSGGDDDSDDDSGSEWAEGEEDE